VYEANIETALELKDLLRIFRKRRAVILIIFAIVVLGTTIFTLRLPRVYEAETTLRVKQAKGLSDSLLSELPVGNPLASKQLMSTYVEIIKSRLVIKEVIKLLERAGVKALNYQTVFKRIIISPVRDTEILKIQARAGSPLEARLLANTVVTVFLQCLSELMQSQQTVIRKFIAGRLVESRLELAQAELALQNYKSRQKIVAPAEETKALVAQMAEFHKLAAENRIVLATGAARVGLANQQLANEKPGFMAENSLIAQCKGKLVDLEAELVGLIQKYTENHPRVMALRATINEVKRKLNEEINRVVNREAVSLNPVHQSILQDKLKAEAELAAALAQKSVLDAIMARNEAVLLQLPAKEAGLARLMRDSLLAQEIYIMLAKRYEEARISEAMQPTDVQVLDRAVAPDPTQPIAPNRKTNIGVGVFLGLLLGMGLAIVLEFFNKTIIGAEDVERYLDLPVLGNIPVFNAKLRQSSHTTHFWERWTFKRKAEG
jgi:succinoglycan biosynthesis transport protein ExoP